MSSHTGFPPSHGDFERQRQRLLSPDVRVTPLNGGFARPDEVEPLASRLERSARQEWCRAMTHEHVRLLLASEYPAAAWPGVWVKGIYVDFVVVTHRGVFLVWPVDNDQPTAEQSRMVMPARAQVQCELGTGWPGQVEAVFHRPRQAPEGARSETSKLVHLDEESGVLVETQIVTGRLDYALVSAETAGGVGVDPEWISWLVDAARPRWWRSGGPTPKQQHPAHEQL